MSGRLVHLTHRAVLSVRGVDSASFLQGLLCNDVRSANTSKAMYSMLLDVRGRIVDDLLVFKDADDYLLESDLSSRKNLQRLLQRFVMHKKVKIDEGPAKVFFFEGTEGKDVLPDPRVPAFGSRVLSSSTPEGTLVDLPFYHSRRFEWGITEGRKEMAGSLPLSRNVDFMNGISGDKGCYVGQETSAAALTAPRVRQRTFPFTCEGDISGPIVGADGTRVGTVLACDGSRGLALLTLAHVSFPADLRTSTGGRVHVFIPSWWPPQPSRPFRPS